MLELLIGILVSVTTQIAKKFKLDAKYVVLGLSLLGGAVYFLLNLFFPEQLEVTWEKVLVIYGTSQLIYNYLIKRFE